MLKEQQEAIISDFIMDHGLSTLLEITCDIVRAERNSYNESITLLPRWLDDLDEDLHAVTEQYLMRNE